MCWLHVSVVCVLVYPSTQHPPYQLLVLFLLCHFKQVASAAAMVGVEGVGAAGEGVVEIVAAGVGDVAAAGEGGGVEAAVVVAEAE